MLSCKAVSRLLSESQERPLKLGERISLRLHLMMCKACKNVEFSMMSLRKLMREYAGRDHPNTPTHQSPQKGQK